MRGAAGFSSKAGAVSNSSGEALLLLTPQREVAQFRFEDFNGNRHAGHGYFSPSSVLKGGGGGMKQKEVEKVRSRAGTCWMCWLLLRFFRGTGCATTESTPRRHLCGSRFAVKCKDRRRIAGVSQPENPIPRAAFDLDKMNGGRMFKEAITSSFRDRLHPGARQPRRHISCE